MPHRRRRTGGRVATARCRTLGLRGDRRARPSGSRSPRRTVLAALHVGHDRQTEGRVALVSDTDGGGNDVAQRHGLLLPRRVHHGRTDHAHRLLPAWDPDDAVRLADVEHGTFSCGATVFLQAYVERYERAAAPSHHLQAFMCGGAAIPPSLIVRADAVGIRAFRSWGLTEVPTIGLVGPNASLELRSARDGRVSEGTEVHAVDESGAILAPGERGELRVRAPERMLGYTDPERNAELISEDGWFRTGDVGSVDADGWITMTGRIKDIISRGGEKFSAQDIENVIADHPAIASVAVIGAPDERLGEKVVAYVTLRPGARWPGDDALIDHLEAQRLAKQKRPTAWRVIDELPATLSGKTQKHLLLALWERDLGPAESAPH
ncbi:MAG: cyclohexanecarboxylate-CoA ligase [Actinobacteria bacterium]|nr:MAG: cyclohexanecarboxylate-CoA ligase [Actinomycetota bacterium]